MTRAKKALKNVLASNESVDHILEGPRMLIAFLRGGSTWPYPEADMLKIQGFSDTRLCFDGIYCSCLQGKGVHE